MVTVSVFKSVKDPNNPFHKPIEYVLNRIRNGNSKDFIEQLRSMSDEDYGKNKSQLPGTCFNGKFKTRSASGLIQHSGFITLDFDKLNSIEEAIELRDSIRSDEYVYAAWISPSGKGIKVLVKIPAVPANHRAYFEALEKHFDHSSWDKSGSDVSRFCFESYDPDMYVNPDSSVWIEMEEPNIENVGTTEPIVRMTSDNQIIEKLLVWWEKKYGMTIGKKNTNLYILASAFYDFGISKDDALHECLKFDSGGKDKEISSIVKSSYKKNTPPGTKHFEDNVKKEKIEKLIRSGKTKKELEEQFDGIDISLLKENIDVDEFWYYTDKGKIMLSTHKFKFWLEQNNFFKYYPSENSNTFTFIKKEQNMIEETSDKLIKDYVLGNILGRDNIGYGPYDFMASNTGYFKQEFLSMLSTTEVKIKEDTASDCFLYYKNCVVNIKKDSVKTIDYIDVDGLVWKKQIINREFQTADHHEAEFRKFIWLISGQDVLKYNSFKSVIGYLLHSFKTSANNKAIVFNDETISENPNGGSGKGLFWNALKNMRKVSRIDGKQFKPDSDFAYQIATPDTQLLVFDDVKKNFKFEDLFSLITEGIIITYKGQTPITLPVEKSPKILITTNYTLGGVGGSFERRKFEIEMSSYFSYKHTPLDEFGHMLFSDWSESEWLKFDNFMINCVQYYLKNGLVKHDFNNLEVRKFIKETSFEFYEWSQDTENMPMNIRLDKAELFTKFCNEYQDYKKWLSQKKFTQWLEGFGKYYKIEFNQGRNHTMRFIEYVTEEKTETDNEVPF